MAGGVQQRRATVPVNGVLLLDKPPGLTSNQALQKVKRLLQARKAGHTGSLDPAATGMLPLCFGEATKICAYLLDADKTYRVVARLGESTDTGDADGTVTATATVPELDAAGWNDVLQGFVGPIQQVPPMYSALKKDGKRLYELARQGQVVERKPRPVTIHGIELLEAHGRRLVFRVSCSKGTYVRTLVEDVAKAAGTIAHTTGLHREAVAAFPADAMHGLDELERIVERDGAEALRATLLPVDEALTHWPACNLSAVDGERFQRGQPVPGGDNEVPGSLLRAYDPAGRFLGIAEAVGDGRLAPKRVFLLDPPGAAGDT